MILNGETVITNTVTPLFDPKVNIYNYSYDIISI